MMRPPEALCSRTDSLEVRADWRLSRSPAVKIHGLEAASNDMSLPHCA